MGEPGAFIIVKFRGNREPLGLADEDRLFEKMKVYYCRWLYPPDILDTLYDFFKGKIDEKEAVRKLELKELYELTREDLRKIKIRAGRRGKKTSLHFVVDFIATHLPSKKELIEGYIPTDFPNDYSVVVKMNDKGIFETLVYEILDERIWLAKYGTWISPEVAEEKYPKVYAKFEKMQNIIRTHRVKGIGFSIDAKGIIDIGINLDAYSKNKSRMYIPEQFIDELSKSKARITLFQHII